MSSSYFSETNTVVINFSLFENSTSLPDFMISLDDLMYSIIEQPTANTVVLKKMKRRGWKDPLDKYLRNKLSVRYISHYPNRNRITQKREPHSRSRK